MSDVFTVTVGRFELKIEPYADGIQIRTAEGRLTVVPVVANVIYVRPELSWSDDMKATWVAHAIMKQAKPKTNRLELAAKIIKVLKGHETTK